MSKSKLQIENIGPLIKFLEELLTKGFVDKDGIKVVSPTKKFSLSFQMDGDKILIAVNGLKLEIDMYIRVDTEVLSLTIEDKEKIIVPSLRFIPQRLTPNIEILS